MFSTSSKTGKLPVFEEVEMNIIHTGSSEQVENIFNRSGRFRAGTICSPACSRAPRIVVSTRRNRGHRTSRRLVFFRGGDRHQVMVTLTKLVFVGESVEK